MKLGISRKVQFQIVGLVAWISMIVVVAWLTLSGIVMGWAGDDVILALFFVLVLLAVAQIVYIVIVFIGGKSTKKASPKILK